MKVSASFRSKLKQVLQQPLPGREAQYKMSHATRKFYVPPVNTPRLAAVLSLFYPKNDKWNMVLIERESSNPNDRHRGQISFPGGKIEEDDPTHAQAAIREAEEEVGVIGGDIEIIGNLTDLYIPVSNFMVYPFVGVMDYTPQFVPQETEVADILEVPVGELLNHSNRKVTDLRPAPEIILKKVPYFDVHGQIIWGATSMILSELMEVLEKVD